MTTIAPASIYQMLLSQGLSPTDAATLTAISGAESSYNPAAVGDVNLETSTWGPSVGLFQIRTLRAQTGKGGTRDINALQSIPDQVNAAVQIWKTQGPTAWTTYSSGAYKKHLGDLTGPQQVADASGRVTYVAGSPGAATAGFDPLNPLGSILGVDPLGAAGNAVGQAAAGAAGAVAGTLWNDIKPVVFTGLFAFSALALVGIGLATAAKVPQRLQSAGSKVGDAALVAGVL